MQFPPPDPAVQNLLRSIRRLERRQRITLRSQQFIIGLIRKAVIKSNPQNTVLIRLCDQHLDQIKSLVSSADNAGGENNDQ